jgi:quinolinate synthase
MMSIEIRNKIRRLTKEKNAIILSHNYQPPEIQDIADLCGDSLELSIRASKTNAKIIVFCGVHFMAETASILCPDKKVLLPRLDAGCPMANMVTADALKTRIAQNPQMPVVTYVNSTADVKALTTICCTSANSINVIKSLDEDEILMVPDRNLAQYTASKTHKTIHYWDGFCPIHDRLTPEAVIKQKQTHPGAVFMAHPECRSDVLALADLVTSTSGMLRYVRESERQSFIIGTEVGLLYPLRKENPDKAFYPASEDLLCPDMKKITLEDVVQTLEELKPEVKVPEHIRKPAFEAVRRMIEL